MRKNYFSVFCLAAAVGGLSLLVCAVSRGLAQTQEQVRAALSVAVFFQANVPDEQSRASSERLKAQDTAIEKMSYLSKEQAYAEASKDPLLNRSLMLLHDNPLSACVELHYSSQAWLQRQDPAQALHQLPGIQEIRWNAARRDSFLAFEPWKKRVRQSMWAVSFMLLLWAMRGIYVLGLTLSEWKQGFLVVLTGMAGAASVLLFWPWMAAGPSFPMLPVLFGGLIGLGSISEKRA